MHPSFWDSRYASEPGYVFGTEPNDFLRSVVNRFRPGGRVLCVAEGEGRNAVFLAEHGFHVTAQRSRRPRCNHNVLAVAQLRCSFGPFHSREPQAHLRSGQNIPESTRDSSAKVKHLKSSK